jgi:hypothetical protein
MFVLVFAGMFLCSSKSYWPHLAPIGGLLMSRRRSNCDSGELDLWSNGSVFMGPREPISIDLRPHIPLQQTTAKIVRGDASPLSWCTILSLRDLGRGRGHLFSNGGRDIAGRFFFIKGGDVGGSTGGLGKPGRPSESVASLRRRRDAVDVGGSRTGGKGLGA